MGAAGGVAAGAVGPCCDVVAIGAEPPNRLFCVRLRVEVGTPQGVGSGGGGDVPNGAEV